MGVLYFKIRRFCVFTFMSHISFMTLIIIVDKGQRTFFIRYAQFSPMSYIFAISLRYTSPSLIPNNNGISKQHVYRCSYLYRIDNNLSCKHYVQFHSMHILYVFVRNDVNVNDYERLSKIITKT